MMTSDLLPRARARRGTLTRFAVTTVALVDSEDAHVAREAVGHALQESFARSVVVLDVEAHGVTIVPDDAAGLAFHCLSEASRLLRGDYTDADEYARAGQLLDEGTVHVGALYLEYLRLLRENRELKSDLTAEVEREDAAHDLAVQLRNELPRGPHSLRIHGGRS